MIVNVDTLKGIWLIGSFKRYCYIITGRFSIDSLENYKTTSQPHTSDSVAITKSEHDRLQQLINAHSVSWIRILDAGRETNSEMRIKNNMLNSDSQVVPLYTLRKDHKEYNDDNSGPPVRPVCGAVVGHNWAFPHGKRHTRRSMEIKREQRHMYEHRRHDNWNGQG